MILLLGGTSDSLLIAEQLSVLTQSFVISTTTEYGKNIANSRFKNQVICGKMTQEDLKAFCIQNKIKIIIDSTHPYAQVISQNAIAVCKDRAMDYYRYERPLEDYEMEKKVIMCTTYEEAGDIVNKGVGNVLLTTGSKNVEKIVKAIEDRDRIYIRLLPTSQEIKKLEQLQLKPKQIIGMQGPFSLEMNLIMLEHIKAKYLITKESGAVGKTKEKIQAALRSNVIPIVIKRPKLHYPTVYYTIDALMAVLKKELVEWD
ncbi:cobalt-precorrin 6A reductase [Natranaerovirga hydrolytica]|uniref:Cobalt-precorrin 6A reductase n=1 Tax=Natranaerovirga hydrolytica TaxID=680378 RepID=A0A4R1N7K9_9FIRM|nr:precorrin-6A reductase [Natranaerovirga hydrolytica]TCK98653.1 cobalt-precorrin 6A reductase [Natranaerovirga hydrolytica]